MLFATLAPTIAYADTYIGGPYPSATQAAFAICGYSWDDYSHEGNSGVAEDMMQSSAGGPYSAFARFANTMHYDVLDHSVWWSSAEGMLYATMKDAAKADIERSIAAHTQESGITHGDGDDSGVTGGSGQSTSNDGFTYVTATSRVRNNTSTNYWLVTDSGENILWRNMPQTLTVGIPNGVVSAIPSGYKPLAYLHAARSGKLDLAIWLYPEDLVTSWVTSSTKYGDINWKLRNDSAGTATLKRLNVDQTMDSSYNNSAAAHYTFDGTKLVWGVGWNEVTSISETSVAAGSNFGSSLSNDSGGAILDLNVSTGGGDDNPTEPDPTPTTPTAPDPPDEPQHYTPTLPTPTYPTTPTINVTTNMYDWSPYFEDILWYLNDIDALLYNLYDVLESHCVHLQQRMHDESLYIGAYLQYVSDTLDATLRGIDSRLAQIAPYPQLMHGQLEQLLGFAYDMWMDLDTVAAELTNIQHPNADTPTDYGVLLQILQAIQGLDVGGTAPTVDLTDIQDTLDAILLDFEQYVLNLMDKLDEILEALSDLTPKTTFDPQIELPTMPEPDMSPMEDALQRMMQKFPFSTINNIVLMLTMLVRPAAAPQFDLPVPNPANWSSPNLVHVDLSIFDIPAAVGRTGIMLWAIAKVTNRTVRMWTREEGNDNA